MAAELEQTVKVTSGWPEFFARCERPPAPKRVGKPPIGQMERRFIEERRELIAQARQNGVSHETIDGRTFTVVHLPPAFTRPHLRA